MGSRARVKWWEPYSYTVRDSLAVARAAGFFSSLFWCRVILISVVVVGGLIACLAVIYRGIVIPWSQLGSRLMFAPMFIFAYVGAALLMPRHVEVRREWIGLMHGQHIHRIAAKRVLSIGLSEREDGGLHLRIEYLTPRGSERVGSSAVRRSVDRAALEALVADLAASAASAPASASQRIKCTPCAEH